MAAIPANTNKATEVALTNTPAPTNVGADQTADFTLTNTEGEENVQVTAQPATVTPVTFARNGIALTKEDAEIVDACRAAMTAVDLSSRKFGQDAEVLYQIGTKMVEKYKDQGHSGKHRTGLTLRDAFAAAGWSYDAWRQWKSRMLSAKKFFLAGIKSLGKKERVKAITGDTLMDVSTKEEFKVEYVLSDTKVGIKKNAKTVEVELYDEDMIPVYENVTPTYTALVKDKDYRSGKNGIVVRLVKFDKEGMPVFEKRAGRTQADIDNAKKKDRLALKAARKGEREKAKKKEQEARAKNAAEKKLGLLPSAEKDQNLIKAAQADRGKKPSKRRKQKEEGIIVARLDTQTTWGIFDSSLFAPYTLAKSIDDVEYAGQAEAEKAAEGLRRIANRKPRQKAPKQEKKVTIHGLRKSDGRTYCAREIGKLKIGVESEVTCRGCRDRIWNTNRAYNRVQFNRSMNVLENTGKSPRTSTVHGLREKLWQSYYGLNIETPDSQMQAYTGGFERVPAGFVWPHEADPTIIENLLSAEQWERAGKNLWKHPDGRLIKKVSGLYKTMDKEGEIKTSRSLEDARYAQRKHQAAKKLEETLETTECKTNAASAGEAL